MAKYTVYLTTTAATSIAVDADDKESAEEAAYEKVPTVCAKCSGWGGGPGIDMGGEWVVEDVEEF